MRAGAVQRYSVNMTTSCVKIYYLGQDNPDITGQPQIELIYMDGETAAMTEQHFDENGFHATSMWRCNFLRPRYFPVS